MMIMPVLYNRYFIKCLKVLNDSLTWNKSKLPHNTLYLQLKKYCEEIDEAIAEEGKDYKKFISELGDVLICIGGVARFDNRLAQRMFNDFISCVDRFIFMDLVDAAEQKLPTLYERNYSDGYHH